MLRLLPIRCQLPYPQWQAINYNSENPLNEEKKSILPKGGEEDRIAVSYLFCCFEFNVEYKTART